jgi:hypothetical protein
MNLRRAGLRPMKPPVPLPFVRRNAGLFGEIGGFRRRLFCAIVPDRCYGETGRMEEMLDEWKFRAA